MNSHTPSSIPAYSIGPKPIKERRWAGILEAVGAWGLCAVILGSVPAAVGFSVYNTWGMPATLHTGRVVGLEDIPYDFIPVTNVDGKGNVSISTVYVPENFEVKVQVDGSNRVTQTSVSQSTYERLSIGSPADVTMRGHRVTSDVSITDVSFPTDGPQRPPRRRP